MRVCSRRSSSISSRHRPDFSESSVPETDALVVEDDRFLRVVGVVQKFGARRRNIDTAACAARGVRVLTIRRRANIACAEHAIALMLTLAKKLHRVTGRISVEQLAQVGYRYKPFDRRHTPNSNW